MDKSIKAAVAAERERCAKIVENWLAMFGAKDPQYVSAQVWANDAMRDILDAIRSESALAS